MPSVRMALQGDSDDCARVHLDVHLPLPTPLPNEQGAREDAEQQRTRKYADIVTQFDLAHCGCKKGQNNVLTCPNAKCPGKQNGIWTDASEQQMPSTTLAATLQELHPVHTRADRWAKLTRQGGDGRVAKEGTCSPGGLQDRWMPAPGSNTLDVWQALSSRLTSTGTGKPGFGGIPVQSLPVVLQTRVQEVRDALAKADRYQTLLKKAMQECEKEPLFQVHTAGPDSCNTAMQEGTGMARELWPQEHLGHLPDAMCKALTQRSAQSLFRRMVCRTNMRAAVLASQHGDSCTSAPPQLHTRHLHARTLQSGMSWDMHTARALRLSRL